MFCKNCGKENPDGAKFCKNCGSPMEAAEELSTTPVTEQTTNQTPTPPSVNGGNYGSAGADGAKGNNGNGYAIASMVLGIVSIVFCCTNLIGMICGILAVVFSKKVQKQGNQSSMAKAGMICGIIGICICAISIVYTIVVICISGSFTFNPYSYSDYYNF